ncbi:MAG: polyprenyl synthetase family protein [Proteobacteria bacterium]|jgi:geranylgeranyl diphosphate synthase type I|nr:polyprenyl synthetase family protein [Pseudomonadota bacterium]
MDVTLQRIAAAVEERLERLFRDDEDDPCELFARRPAPMLLERVRDLTLRGGKRIRAALVYAGALLVDAAGGGATALCDAAAAMELLHTYFLIHDDIMDDDLVRRGGPSVHAALTAATGDAKLGRDLAILAGDLSVSLHERLIARLDIAEERRRRVASLFAGMHADVIHGQALDLLGGPSEEVADHKTASYTTVGPIAIGAAIAGASPGDTARLAAIARPIGIAFQLRDDVIGAFGDPAITGKPRGSDLRSGKRTLLIQQALSRAGADERAALAAAFGRADASEGEIAAATRAIASSGAKRFCEERAADHVAGALAALEKSGFGAEGRAMIAHIARLAVTREK